MVNKEKIFVFGASGHAKVVIDIIEKQGCYEIVFLADDDLKLKGNSVYGYQVIGGKNELIESDIRLGIVAIGSNSARISVARWLITSGFELVSAIHPSAVIARGVSIGCNCVIMAGAVINSDCHVGDSVIVNTRASIDHDCIIGNGVHLAPGTTLCGAVTVGESSFVCAGVTIIPNLCIGSNVVIGAGSTIIRNLPDNVKAVGSPARIF